MKAGVLVWLPALMVGVALVYPPAVAEVQQGGGAQAPAAIDSAAFEQGRKLYESSCVACHQVNGSGMPPAMPALNGNERLSDVDQMVRTIRLGRGGMLAFPQLSAGEIAAVVTYVRNAWGNKFGAVTAGQVEAVLAGLAKPDGTKPAGGAKVSVWSGVYTADQKERGATFYEGACAHCHGRRLNGAGAPDQPPSPAVAGAGFLRKWQDQSVAALFTYVRTKMPPDNPGAYGDQDNVDVVAYMFSVSNMPAGDKELPTDPKALEGIVIEMKSK